MVHSDVFAKFQRMIIFAGRGSNEDLNSLSSGRISHILRGWELFTGNMLWGCGKPHRTFDCFYISALANFGLLSCPIVIMSLYPFFWAKSNLRDDKSPLALTFFLMTLAIGVISLLEERAPFGPGARCYVLWLSWGIYLAMRQDEGKTKLPDSSLERTACVVKEC